MNEQQVIDQQMFIAPDSTIEKLEKYFSRPHIFEKVAKHRQKLKEQKQKEKREVS